MTRNSGLAASLAAMSWALLLGLSNPALALSNSFSYQGSLMDSGQAANGSYDLQFELQTQAGVAVGSPVLLEDVAIIQGVFTVDLDFGAAVTSGDFQLQIGIRPGSSTGSYTLLSTIIFRKIWTSEMRRSMPRRSRNLMILWKNYVGSECRLS